MRTPIEQCRTEGRQITLVMLRAARQPPVARGADAMQVHPARKGMP